MPLSQSPPPTNLDKVLVDAYMTEFAVAGQQDHQRLEEAGRSWVMSVLHPLSPQSHRQSPELTSHDVFNLSHPFLNGAAVQKIRLERYLALPIAGLANILFIYLVGSVFSHVLTNLTNKVAWVSPVQLLSDIQACKNRCFCCHYLDCDHTLIIKSFTFLPLVNSES